MSQVDLNRSKRFQNVHYKSDSEYVVRVARTLLRPVGLWPLDKTDTTLAKIRTIFQNGSIFFLICFLLIPHVIYTFFDVEDLKRYMKVIAAQVFSLLAVIKFWTVIVNKREIGHCLQDVVNGYRDVECEEDRLIMIANAKTGRLFTAMYLGLCYGGAVPYHIVLPLLAEKVVKEDNTTWLPLPYLSDYVFFDVEITPLYEIIFVTQMCISCVILSTNCGVYSMIVSCVMHACCLFEIVRKHMENVVEGGTNNLQRRLCNIIEEHMNAIRFAEKIEKALNIVFLSEMVGCTIVICFLEYGVLQDWEDRRMADMITYFILMTAIFVNVFIISFIGDRLAEESEKVGEATYAIQWYRLPKEFARDLILIISRSCRPSNLTAGKIFDVSLLGFCDVSLNVNISLASVRRSFHASWLRLRDNEANMSTASVVASLEVHPRNEYHALDFKYASQISIWLLKPIGGWPLDDDASTLDKVIYVLSIVVAGCLQLFMIVPWCIYLITAKVSFYDFIRTACPLIFSITVFVRYVLLLVHRSQIKSCINRVAEDWRNVVQSEDRAMMLVNAKSGRLYGMCSVAFMYGSGVLYSSIPIFTPDIVTEDNVTIRALANPCELLIFDSQVGRAIGAQLVEVSGIIRVPLAPLGDLRIPKTPAFASCICSKYVLLFLIMKFLRAVEN
ncbi:hypothetical protein KM043_005938 [Ampulex compressa]|nr:hypothetical protein KM043_005938 [Ampulex compressa]